MSVQSQLALFPVGVPAVSEVWAFGGSRVLGSESSQLATAAASALLARGHRLAVGCCTGADACALSAAVALGLACRVEVFAAFGASIPPGRWPLGACPASAVSEVRRAVSEGAQLRAWAGGGVSVPLSTRLAARTRAVARACNAGAVVVLAPHSKGSLILARAVAGRGLPVVVVPVAGAALPVLSAGGRWSAVSAAPLASLGAQIWRA
ncbi:hypothetical protein EDC35_10443 [Thiobaca trueperi]|uniref:Uncharacterized protein n=1 Tax=Thiobaca trueperi TaxID=127458 RepID=A0A4R3MX72_9GAMM|nr:hypothetical protein EDC35_10443 [Thiobaca trueperi]